MKYKYPFSNYLSTKKYAIFLFHGVVDKKNIGIKNYTSKHIHFQKFKQILKDLKNNGQVLSMDDLIKIKQQKISLPEKSFSITFDDGYYNNYSIAAPILNDLNLSATFYVTTNFIENNSMSWIDMIEDSINNQKINKKINYKNIKLNTLNQKNKKIFLNYLRKNIKRNKTINPYNEVKKIAKLNSLVLPIKKNNIFDKKMSWKNLINLSKEKNFLIGGHGKSHQILSYLPQKELNKEIEESIDKISKKLNKNIKHYSYPEGLNFCYGAREIKILKKNGIETSPTAIEGLNNSQDDLFKLKRIFCY